MSRVSSCSCAGTDVALRLQYPIPANYTQPGPVSIIRTHVFVTVVYTLTAGCVERVKIFDGHVRLCYILLRCRVTRTRLECTSRAIQISGCHEKFHCSTFKQRPTCPETYLTSFSLTRRIVCSTCTVFSVLASSSVPGSRREPVQDEQLLTSSALKAPCLYGGVSRTCRGINGPKPRWSKRSFIARVRNVRKYRSDCAFS